MSSKVEILGYEEYITQNNDTFDLIAYKQYGNEFLAGMLIQENPRHSDVLLFEPGVTLWLPVIEELEIADSLPPWRKGDENEADL